MIRSKKSKSLPEINTTALPDIIFMLLFFFMVVTVLKKDNKSVHVKIPEVGYAELLKGDNLILLTIQAQDQGYIYYLDSHPYSDLKLLKKGLQQALLSTEDIQRVKIQADKALPIATINEIKQVLQETKFYNVEYIAATMIQ